MLDRGGDETGQNAGIRRKSAKLIQNRPKAFNNNKFSKTLRCRTIINSVTMQPHSQYHANAAGPRCHANHAAAAKSDAIGKCRAAHAPSPIHHLTANTFTKARQL
jgi:hypothetical protein